MTYIKKNIYKKINGNVNVYYDASATIGNDQPVSWSSLDSSFSSNFTLSKTASQFTLPNDGKTYILKANITANQGSLENTYVEFQWYDITNSTYVGIKGKTTGGYNKNEGRSGNVVANEEAIFVSNQSNTYELRITSYSNVTDIDATDTDYSGKARCCIWRI